LIERTDPFFLFLGLVLVVLLGSAAFVHLGLKTQIYVWEFRIDLRSAVFAILCVSFSKWRHAGFEFTKIGMWKWNLRSNILAFFFPFGLFVLLILGGLLFKTIDYQGVENSATFLLATVFDIPATYFFSVTTVLLEEIVFRGFVFSAVMKGKNIFLPSLLASGLWALMCIGGVFQDAGANFRSILFGFVNLVSIGFVCSSLYLSSGSIWSSYSFRIGLIVFSTALLSESPAEANSFFSANTFLFSSNGLLITLFNFIFASLVLKLRKRPQNPDIIK